MNDFSKKYEIDGKIYGMVKIEKIIKKIWLFEVLY
jgi:hypothetical protein